MNTPSPAIVKKIVDQRKALESYEQPASSASVSSGTDSGSGRSKKSRGTSENQAHGRPNSKPSKTTSTPTHPKEFVRPEHLLTKPLKDHPGLEALKNSLGDPKQSNNKENN